jgi:hypothetical protein
MSMELKNQVAHFTAILNIAAIYGQINDDEKSLLIKFANKLDISEYQVTEVMENPSKYSISPAKTKEERLDHLYDLFRMIFTVHICSSGGIARPAFACRQARWIQNPVTSVVRVRFPPRVL